MNGRGYKRPSHGRRKQLRLGGVAAALLLAAVACTGENIFPTGVVGGGDDAGASGVEITAPADGAAVPVSDSVEVTASFTSADGVNQISFTHSYPGGASQRIVSFATVVTDSTVSRKLGTGTTAGTGTIVVETTDVLGAKESDTITVTIG